MRVLIEDDDFLSLFKLPDYETLLKRASGRWEEGLYSVICGQIHKGRNGPLGLHVIVASRQRTFWLPSDAPGFDNAHRKIRMASDSRDTIKLVLDPVDHIILYAGESV